MNDPHIWWYISRVSALVAWGLMSFSIVWGVLLASRVFRGLDNLAWLKDLHKYLGTLTILLASIHTSALMLDPYVKFDSADLFIPGVASYQGSTEVVNFALAIGVVSMWIITFIYLTSLVMDKLPRWLWKGIHFASYLVFFGIAVHAALAGTDVGTWWYAAVSIFVITMSMIALIIRLTMVALKERRDEKEKKIALIRKNVQSSSANSPITEDSREKRPMLVREIIKHSEKIIGIKLVPAEGGRVAWWDAGSHITLHLENGKERQYSLCGDSADRSGYEIAVLDTMGEGGSSTWIHKNLKVGSMVTVSGPRNHFQLVPAYSYLFIAGGIGITPIRAMIESLPASRDWQLLYLGKNRDQMAFANELQTLYGNRVLIHDSSTKGRIKLGEILNGLKAEIYACGPESLLTDIERITAPERCHIERFNPVERQAPGGPQPLVVTLALSGKSVKVAANESITEALKKAGAPVDQSCGRGVCGTCELRVIAGEPLHLDSVMSDTEKNQLGVFYPCVSRAKTQEIVVEA